MGTFGDFAIFSTGRDKVISSVNGGFLLINNSKYNQHIDGIRSQLVSPPLSLTKKNLAYNIVAYIAGILYDVCKIGRGMMYLARKFGMFPDILSQREKQCDFRDFFWSLPDALSCLVSQELENIESYHQHRIQIARQYDATFTCTSEDDQTRNIFFRYAYITRSTAHKHALVQTAKKQGIRLGTSW